MEPITTPNVSDAIAIKILVADDDTPTRILLKTAISQWGFTVVEAKDGEEAWNIMQGKDSPSILILDWLMPKLDGVELCRRSREKLYPHPYVILLTQLSGSTNVVTGLEAGADEFLTKPFNMPELRSRINAGKRIVRAEQELIYYKEKLQNTIHIAKSIRQTLEQAASSHSEHNNDLLDEQITQLDKKFKELDEALKRQNEFGRIKK